MSVMVVVPAFAERKPRNPPIVARIVTGVEAAASPHVRGRVDEPRGVQTENDAQKYAPQK
jgi:hypothetical protein